MFSVNEVTHGKMSDIMAFKTLGLIEPLLRAVADEGYETPSPIQEKTIPLVLEGKDVLGLAQTGTGKTASFALPTLQLLSKTPVSVKRKIRALVVTPTRELAIQVHESFENYGHYLPLRSTVIFGGIKQGRQVNALRSGIDVLVATPGRLLDLISQGYIDLSAIEIFILDEADRMLDMGFVHDIRKIAALVPKQRQTLLYSATLPQDIEKMVHELQERPTTVSVAPVSSTAQTVEQSVIYVDKEHKVTLLSQLVKAVDGEPILVFSRTKRSADKLVRGLKGRGIEALAIHGDKSQNARQAALEAFKSREVQVLVATDIASRGIDIQDLNYVVNVDLPEVPETYVHRIGRTGRAGNFGKAWSLVSYPEIPLLKAIESLTRVALTEIPNHEYPMVDKSDPKKGKNNARTQPRVKKAFVSQNKSKDAKQSSRKPQESRKQKDHMKRDASKPKKTERKKRSGDAMQPRGARKASNQRSNYGSKTKKKY